MIWESYWREGLTCQKHFVGSVAANGCLLIKHLFQVLLVYRFKLKKMGTSSEKKLYLKRKLIMVSLFGGKWGH